MSQSRRSGGPERSSPAPAQNALVVFFLVQAFGGSEALSVAYGAYEMIHGTVYQEQLDPEQALVILLRDSNSG